MVTISMMSAKIATPGLCKIMIFWGNGYDVIGSVDNVTKKPYHVIQNYIADVVMWPKSGNSGISMGEFIITSNL